MLRTTGSRAISKTDAGVADVTDASGAMEIDGKERLTRE